MVLSPRRNQTSENVVVVAQLAVKRIREVVGFRRAILAIVYSCGISDYDELLRGFYRQHLQQERIHERENRRVCANAERERKHGDSGERRALGEHAQAITNILGDGFHHVLNRWGHRMKSECQLPNAESRKPKAWFTSPITQFFSLIPQRYDWIHLCGAPRGNVARQQSDCCEQNRNDYKSARIRRLNLEQHAHKYSAGGERP